MPSSSSAGGLDRVVGQPDVRANTFVEPPGRTPSAVSVPASPLATSFSVPSPPSTDHHVDAAAGGVLGEAGGVAAAVGLDELDLVVRGQRLLHDDRVARRHRRGERVDDQQDPQGARRYRDVTPVRAASRRRLVGR